MKKNYQTPAMQVMNIEPATMIAGSEVHSIGGNALKYGGAGSNNDVARGRDGGGYWDDEE